jgi:hypothetical protein
LAVEVVVDRMLVIQEVKEAKVGAVVALKLVAEGAVAPIPEEVEVALEIVECLEILVVLVDQD